MNLLQNFMNIFAVRQQEQDEHEDNKVEMRGVFYVKREMNAFDGSFFRFSKSKMICNPNDKFKFYLKVGAITCADAQQVEGRQRRQVEYSFRYTNNRFGSFVFISPKARKYQRKLRTIVSCRTFGYPNRIQSYGLGILNAIYPRIDGETGNTLLGLDLHFDKTSDRKWSKFDGKNPIVKENVGFSEIYEFSVLEEVVRKHRTIRIDGMLRDNEASIVIYVPKNASLLMSDFVDPSLAQGEFRNRVSTLFQEGSVLTINHVIAFKFYDIDEMKSLNVWMLTDERQQYRKLMSKTRNLDQLRRIRFGESTVIFLSPTENGAFWSLRVPPVKNWNRKSIILCIPSGGQFEEVFSLDKGLKEIENRQLEEPWKRYVKLVDETNEQFIDEINGDGVYP